MMCLEPAAPPLLMVKYEVALMVVLVRRLHFSTPPKEAPGDKSEHSTQRPLPALREACVLVRNVRVAKQVPAAPWRAVRVLAQAKLRVRSSLFVFNSYLFFIENGRH